MRELTVAEVERVAFELARKLMEWDEPIPKFGSRYPHTLESCLGKPMQTYDSKELYPSLLDKAAILFYLMIKNHPFQNGNKRIAVMTLLLFLSVNKKWMNVPNQKLYNFAKWIAESDPKVKSAAVQAIKDWLKPLIVDA